VNLFKKLGETEIKKILYRQLVLIEPLNEIYHDSYSHYCSLSGFRSFTARVITYPEFSMFIVENLMSEEKYDFNYGRTTVLNSKKESYWKDEEERIFHLATYNSLSHEEKLIFSEAYLERYSKTI